MAKQRGRQKGEQQHLPQMAPRKHPTIHPLALDYVRVRDRRMLLTDEETELQDRLLEAMKKAGFETYEYEDINVYVSHGDESVKVKKKKASEK